MWFILIIFIKLLCFFVINKFVHFKMVFDKNGPTATSAKEWIFCVLRSVKRVDEIGEKSVDRFDEMSPSVSSNLATSEWCSVAFSHFSYYQSWNGYYREVTSILDATGRRHEGGLQKAGVDLTKLFLELSDVLDGLENDLQFVDVLFPGNGRNDFAEGLELAIGSRLLLHFRLLGGANRRELVRHGRGDVRGDGDANHFVQVLKIEIFVRWNFRNFLICVFAWDVSSLDCRNGLWLSCRTGVHFIPSRGRAIGRPVSRDLLRLSPLAVDANDAKRKWNRGKSCKMSTSSSSTREREREREREKDTCKEQNRGRHRQQRDQIWQNFVTLAKF